MKLDGTYVHFAVKFKFEKSWNVAENIIKPLKIIVGKLELKDDGQKKN
jgi:hypothetical protein